MALHPDFPRSPHAVPDPAVRWFPADETLRDTGMEKLMPPLLAQLRNKIVDIFGNDTMTIVEVGL